MNKATDFFGFFCASCTLTILAGISLVTAATLVWVMLI